MNSFHFILLAMAGSLSWAQTSIASTSGAEKKPSTENIPAQASGEQPESQGEVNKDYVLKNGAMRRKKSFYFLGEFPSFTLTPMIGLRAGMYANERMALESSLNIGGFFVSKALFEFKAKYFLLDSFYVDGGYSREAFVMKYDSAIVSRGSSGESTNQEEPTQEDTTVTNDGITVHIGNQWQWSWFTLGCDWLGFMYAFNTNVKKPKVVDEYWQNRVSWLKGNSFHLLRLYFGIAL